MAETKRQTTRQTRFIQKEPSRYNVIMHNDDVTTMEFVVMVLKRLFHKSAEEAEELMLTVHNEGSAIVGTYSKDIAQSKADYTMQLARENGYPLKLTIKEV